MKSQPNDSRRTSWRDISRYRTPRIFQGAAARADGHEVQGIRRADHLRRPQGDRADDPRGLAPIGRTPLGRLHAARALIAELEARSPGKVQFKDGRGRIIPKPDELRDAH